ncbi:MAG: ribonuclease VapC29 [Chloroflexota bacterium]
MALLLDSNVLIALLSAGHVHHAAAREWFAGLAEPFATCPITEGSLVRHVLRGGESPRTATVLLQAVSRHPSHVFWIDSLPYTEVGLDGVIGHGQVTDAYLVALARAHDARLATFDRGLFEAYRDAVELVPGAAPR